MSKKILILSTSPRRGSNSEALAEAFAKGAAESGHEVELIAMREKDMIWEITDYLKDHPKTAVINLGCGLNMTGRMADNGTCHICNLDFPDVIKSILTANEKWSKGAVISLFTPFFSAPVGRSEALWSCTPCRL